MKHLLGIDFGGGASKATLINENGNFVSAGFIDIHLHGGGVIKRITAAPEPDNMDYFSKKNE